MQTPGITFGPFIFDPHRRLLKRDSVELPLPPRVLGVLEVLLGRAGEVVPRQELIDTVWKDAFVTDTSLAEAVSVLRQTLGDDPQAPSYIQTLHRRGYRFVAPVAETGTLTVSAGTVPETVSVPVSLSPSIGGQLLPWSVAAVCLILAAVAVWQAVMDRDATASPVTRFAIAPAPGTRFDGRAPALAVSPDATRAAWSACDSSGCRIYVRATDRLDPAPLAGTDDAAAPFFSPDGRWIGFFADGRLKKVAVAGGAPVTLADAADALGGVWIGNRGIIYAGAGPGLRTIRETGGEWTTLTEPRAADGEVRHVWPSLSPSPDSLMFTVTGIPGVDGRTRLGISRLDSPDTRSATLIAGADRAAAVADDLIVFSIGSELQAAAFDRRSRGLAGAPHTLAGDIAVSGGAGQFAASPSGALLSLGVSPVGERPSLVWWTPASLGDAASRQEGAPRTRGLGAIALSPDGRRVAGIDRAEAGRSDVWIADLERGTASRLTHEAINAAPVWSPDGTRVFFASSDGGPFAIHVRDAESLRPARRLHGGAEHALPCSVAPDGSMVAFISRGASTGTDVWGLPLAGGPAQPLIRTPFDDVAAVFSPDGRSIAYQSNDAGRWEIYVHRRSDQRRIAVSIDGGTDPFWSADGRSLFFRSRDRLMRAAVTADGSSAGPPEVLATFADAVPIAADARERVLFQRRSPMPADVAVLTLQWAREVRQILGPPAATMPR